MTARILKSASLAAVLTSSLLGACQTTASAPVVCDVTAADIEGLQNQYRARFETITTALSKLQDVGSKSMPPLKKPFEKKATETLSVSADKPDASIGYSWRVNLAKGCALDARLGTNTQSSASSTPNLDVKALSFSGEKLPDGTSRFDPLKIIINK